MFDALEHLQDGSFESAFPDPSPLSESESSAVAAQPGGIETRHKPPLPPRSLTDSEEVTRVEASHGIDGEPLEPKSAKHDLPVPHTHRRLDVLPSDLETTHAPSSSDSGLVASALADQVGGVGDEQVNLNSAHFEPRKNDLRLRPTGQNSMASVVEVGKSRADPNRGLTTPDAQLSTAESIEIEMPEVLRDDMLRVARFAKAARWRAYFVVLSFVMLGVLGFQVAAFQPQEVLIRYPQAEPILKQLCVLVGCRLPQRRDPTAIRVVSRDVRIHPDYQGALSITATLINTASYRQEFPHLQFTLFNVNGQIIASRIFKPQEYLNRVLSSTERLRPRRPLQIAIELMSPEQAAVSFEFRFL